MVFFDNQIIKLPFEFAKHVMKRCFINGFGIVISISTPRKTSVGWFVLSLL